MPTESLFGSLALRLGAHPENLATEAFHYILRRYQTAMPALRRLFASAGLDLPDDIVTRTQVQWSDGAIPDLVGTDGDGAVRLVLEAKFWASLTEHQPVSYVRGLSTNVGSLLLFVAPAQRHALLWAKLVEKCVRADLPVSSIRDVAPDLRIGDLGAGRTIALSSWRMILDCWLQTAARDHDDALKSDVVQLLGLCDRMDHDAFQPLRAEELGQDVGQRVDQLARLVDDVVQELQNRNLASTKGLRSGGEHAAYGKYYLYGQRPTLLQFSPSLWAQYGAPIWLNVYTRAEGTTTWVADPQANEFLRSRFGSASRPVVENWGAATISLEIPTGVERADVLASLVDQAIEIGQALYDWSEPAPSNEGKS